MTAWSQEADMVHRGRGRAAKYSRKVLFLSLPPGFSITELQKKQAMLNASKQVTGKPKGKWVAAPHCQDNWTQHGKPLDLDFPSKTSSTWVLKTIPLSYVLFPKAGGVGQCAVLSLALNPLDDA